MVPCLSARHREAVQSTSNGPVERRDNMSGVSFLTAVKTFTPGRRRRRCEKGHRMLDLPPAFTHCGHQPDVVPCWDGAPPITPPADFLPPGYKKGDRYTGMNGQEKLFFS